MIYYRALAVVGLACEVATMYFVDPRALPALVSKGSWSPIIAGATVTLLVAWLIDRRAQRAGGILWAPVIFASGAVVGCVANFIYFGPAVSPFDYILVPLYPLLVVGTPLSLILGASGKLVSRLTRSN